LWNANNFLIQNKCEFKSTKKPPKFKININKWVYSELLETKKIVAKNIKDYRFDEAARNAYQFVWHSFCDWYLEFSKTILYSNNKKDIIEIREVSGFVFKEILILMHPFIPFVTEEIWLKNKLDNSGKNYLMFSNWISGKIKKDKDFKEVEKIINIISQIRSFKNELNVSPGSFIDISLGKINKKNQVFFKENEIVLKRLGRINNFFNKDVNKPSATLVMDGDLFKLYFEENVDLNLIKENLISKQRKYETEMGKIDLRLKNKNFVDRAPKHIVDQEKTNYNNLKNNIRKILLTIKSL
jgi:valyl-tRNA synthetase